MMRIWLLASILIAWGCGGGDESPAGKIRVEFWHAMGDRGHQELLQKFADDYNALHPEAEVVPVFQGLYGALYQKLIAAITSRNPPALAQMYESWTTRLYIRGRLEPVQGYIEGPNGYSPEELADFFPAFLEDSRWDGSLVTMPFNKSAYVLQYNADLLARAGFHSAPQTWRELREIALAVGRLKTEDGRPCSGFLVRPQLESFATLFFSGGGQFLDARMRPQMQSPLAARALGFLTDLIHEDRAAHVESNYPATRFGAGGIGMYIYSSASFPFNDRFVAGKFTWRAAPVPAPEGVSPEQRKTLFQGMNVGLLSENPPEVRAAAWDFLKFMLEPQRVAQWAMQTGYCPVRRSAIELPEMQAYLERNPNYRVPFQEVAHAAFEPKPDFWESWRTDVGAEITTAIQGIKSAEEALGAAQRDGEDALRYDSKVARRN